MKQELRYIDLSWAVVALHESETFTWQDLVREGNPVDKVEQYVLGYMSFWQIAFIDGKRLSPVKMSHCGAQPATRLSDTSPSTRQCSHCRASTSFCWRNLLHHLRPTA